MEPLEHWQATFRADGPSSESSAPRTSSGCSLMMVPWQASRSESTLVGSSTAAVRKSRAHVFSTCSGRIHVTCDGLQMGKANVRM